MKAGINGLAQGKLSYLMQRAYTPWIGSYGKQAVHDFEITYRNLHGKYFRAGFVQFLNNSSSLYYT